MKTLAARNDLITEYTESVKSSDRAPASKRSHLAAEALAGLASTEDFKSFSLKSSAVPITQSWLPHKPLMLIHVKGRTHVQVRLVEPIFSAVNRGDCFLLVTKQKLFRFVGEFANVIERTRSQQLVAMILEHKGLGCTATREVLVQDNKDGTIGGGANELEFWRLLKRPEEWQTVIGTGHADEDDLFEQSLIETNTAFEYKEEKLIPLESGWGVVPKVEILDDDKVLVFNFGAEVYVWNGKNAKQEDKRVAMKLAQEFFAAEIGDSYSACDISPINFSQFAGHRHIVGDVVRRSDGAARRDWCLLARINQHMETVLFTEKFLDWPEEVKRDDLCKDYDQSEMLVDVQVPDGRALFNEFKDGGEEVNLMLENANLGRGDFYYDNDTFRHFDVVTNSVDKWMVSGETGRHEEVAKKAQRHFYSADSYIVRWMYQLSCTVRDLSGKPSEKGATVGRSRCAYFCWQGTDSTPNERGAAALCLNELDKEKGAQVRLSQGEESAAFVRLFKLMVMHSGKPGGAEAKLNQWRMFIVTGNDVAETVLTEVECGIEQLRSKTCFVLVHGKKQSLILWMGRRAPKHVRQLSQNCVEQLAADLDMELFGPGDAEETEIEEVEEGEEEQSFFDAVGGDDRSKYCRDERPQVNDNSGTTRVFHFTSSVSGVFEATEVFYNLRAKELCSPYPVQQSVLYEARQPTMFLVDDGDKLWLWCGWWPKEEDDKKNSGKEGEDEEGSGSGSGSPSLENRAGEFRWLDERRAALETCIAYWRAKQEAQKVTVKEADDDGQWGRVVWAGLEPKEFKAILPEWKDVPAAKEMNELVSGGVRKY